VIVGVGLDVVDIARFAAALDRTPGLAARLFTPAERVLSDGGARPLLSLAARFAAKEALAKSLGVPGGLQWHDAEVVSTERGRPLLEVRGTVAAAVAGAGITSLHLSLSHETGLAAAVVVAEG
jgi:holo-[acyl-carrier protein] synthase